MCVVMQSWGMICGEMDCSRGYLARVELWRDSCATLLMLKWLRLSHYICLIFKKSVVGSHTVLLIHIVPLYSH